MNYRSCTPAEELEFSRAIERELRERVRELEDGLKHIRDCYYSTEMCKDIAAAALDGRDDYQEPPR